MGVRLIKISKFQIKAEKFIKNLTNEELELLSELSQGLIKYRKVKENALIDIKLKEYNKKT